MVGIQSNNFLGTSCPSSGTFYVCDKQPAASRFVGCCTVDPCTSATGNTCPQKNLQAASFAAASYNSISAQACLDDGSLWYTCQGSSPPFMGCCRQNACQAGGCTGGFLGRARLSDNATSAEVFLELATGDAISSASSSSSITSSSSRTTSAPSSSRTTATTLVTDTTSLTFTSKATSSATGAAASKDAGSSSPSSSSISGGAIAGIAIAAVAIIAAAIFFCLYRKRRFGRKNKGLDGGFRAPSASSGYESKFRSMGRSRVDSNMTYDMDEVLPELPGAQHDQQREPPQHQQYQHQQQYYPHHQRRDQALPALPAWTPQTPQQTPQLPPYSSYSTYNVSPATTAAAASAAATPAPRHVPQSSVDTIAELAGSPISPKTKFGSFSSSVTSPNHAVSMDGALRGTDTSFLTRASVQSQAALLPKTTQEQEHEQEAADSEKQRLQKHFQQQDTAAAKLRSLPQFRNESPPESPILGIQSSMSQLEDSIHKILRGRTPDPTQGKK